MLNVGGNLYNALKCEGHLFVKHEQTGAFSSFSGFPLSGKLDARLTTGI